MTLSLFPRIKPDDTYIYKYPDEKILSDVHDGLKNNKLCNRDYNSHQHTSPVYVRVNLTLIYQRSVTYIVDYINRRIWFYSHYLSTVNRNDMSVYLKFSTYFPNFE